MSYAKIFSIYGNHGPDHSDPLSRFRRDTARGRGVIDQDGQLSLDTGRELFPKLMMTRYRGRFYLPGCAPQELLGRWNTCRDLAQQLSLESLECKAGKRAPMTELEILDQYLPHLVATNWTSEAEAKWIIRRTAELLNWQAPPSAFV